MNDDTTNESEPTPTAAPTKANRPTKPRRIIRRSNKPSASSSSSVPLPPHLTNNRHLHQTIATTLPADYEFEILKTIHRIESLNARHVALQMPEGLLMYATVVADILRRFSYTADSSSSSSPLIISILSDVTYGACCIDDLTAQSLNVELLVHYGHSCLVPTTVTVVPCLYVFVEIRVDVGHLVESVRLTFETNAAADDGDTQVKEEGGQQRRRKIVECAVMGTVQFRSAVVEAAQRLNQLHITNTTDTSLSSFSSSSSVQYQAIVPQAKPLSPGEVLGCTAPSGLADLNWKEAMMSPRERREVSKKNRQVSEADDDVVTTNNQDYHRQQQSNQVGASKPERIMIFLADGRFHLEAAMISNPSLRALRYDPYSKTLSEEKYEIVKMKQLRREAVGKVRDLLGVNTVSSRVESSSTTAPRSGEDIATSLLNEHPRPYTSSIATNATYPKTMGIILGTLGRQGNPGILARIRSLLHKRGVRTMIVLLSEIFPKKLEMLSAKNSCSSDDGRGGVCAWVQIACPRLR